MISLSWAPTTKQLRQFALACPVGFGLFGWMLERNGCGAEWLYGGIGFGLLLLVVGLAKPLALRPLYALIMALAAPIGWLVSSALALVFHWLVLAPVGLLFRLFGRDPLALRRGRGSSQWRERRADDDPKSYYRQT